MDSYRRRRVYTGRIVARRTADLGFERLAKLVRVAADEGDRVEQGAVLAEIDTRSLRLARKETLALRAQAAAKLAELRRGPRRQTIGAARARVHDLEAQLELSRRKLKRARSLRARETIGQEALDESEFATRALEARLEAAQQHLDELVEGTRKEQVQAQEALVAQLDAQLASIDLELEKSVLRAPFGGRIARRFADEGHVVAPRELVLRLVESDALEARVGLPARMAGSLRPGRGLPVSVDGRLWKAKFRIAMPDLDRVARTRTVVLDLEPGAAAAVVPGQIARVETDEKVETDGFWLANTALVKSTRGLWSVYVLRDGRLERREVEVLYTQSDRVLVRGTLESGELVMKSGTHRVVPGQRVAHGGS